MLSTNVLFLYIVIALDITTAALYMYICFRCITPRKQQEHHETTRENFNFRTTVGAYTTTGYSSCSSGLWEDGITLTAARSAFKPGKKEYIA